MKILIVDDSRAMQAIVRRSVLSSGLTGVEIASAASGSDALEMLDQLTPDLILTDWHMPGMSGLEMVQNMRQLGLTQTIVGFITTESKPDMIDQALRTGARFFLNKPFTDEDLRLHLQAISVELQGDQGTHHPVLLAPLQELIKDALGPVPFRLVEQAMTREHLSSENLLALYSSETTKAFAAVGVMDTHMALMLHAGSHTLPPPEARPLIDAGKLQSGAEVQAAALLERLAAAVTLREDGSVKLVRQSVVNKNFAKLQELMIRNRGASCFRLDIPGYGSGRLAVLLM